MVKIGPTEAVGFSLATFAHLHPLCCACVAAHRRQMSELVVVWFVHGTGTQNIRGDRMDGCDSLQGGGGGWTFIAGLKL